jgi:monoamine oxidase
MATYDYIIVGAGIAGLHTAILLQKKYPKAKIAILERYKYNGGRVVTYKHDIPGYGKVQWENGAGRIHCTKHPLVMKYLHRYGLTFSPIGDVMAFVGSESQSLSLMQTNIFESTYLPIIHALLQELSAEELRQHTIKELLEKIMDRPKAHEFLTQFAYNSELDVLRADWALQVFEGEMGSSSGFGVCKEGLSKLIAGMVADFKGDILEEHYVKNVNPDSLEVEVVSGKDGPIIMQAQKAVVLALHLDALCEIKSVRGWKMLQHVKMRPLLRTYAVFPGKPFKGVSKIVEDGGLRYFIPMGDSVAMISYTDGSDAEKYIKILDNEGASVLCEKLMRELRKLFPNIKDPIFFKAHPWRSGCSYWLPGDYDVEVASVEAHTPFPGKAVYVCGESFSTRQAWMEGALEHAESLFKNVKL